MLKRKTQSLSYWRDEYEIDEADHEFLYETLVDASEPQSSEGLALRIIDRRCQIEDNRIHNELARGLIFDPKDTYSVDDQVVFPVFDFRLAKVIDTRQGQNPEHGDFQVMAVHFEDDGKARLFAMSLGSPHKLNRDADDLLFSEEESLTPAEIFEEVGDAVTQRVAEYLRSQPDYFVSAGPLWLTTDQMVQVNVGHLNIAEAAIEMKGEPVPTRELLDLVDMDRDVSEAVRVFSLETAMLADERFAQVGVLGDSAWFLRRMMPQAALEIPQPLRHVPVPFNRAVLDVELMQTEWEINDEWTEGGLAENVPPEVPSFIVRLIYPHLFSGTLPLTAAARAVFPEGSGFCTQLTLIDGRWGNRFPGWVVHEGRYVAGLEEWYKQHKLPVGAQITIERTNNPLEVVIDFKPLRMKREWVRVVRVEEGHLVFQMQRKQIACEYDDHLALWVDNPKAVAELSATLQEEAVPVEELVAAIMPELIKLSPQGTTHVKSLYSAVNTIRRMSPGPIFAALAGLPDATDTGSGYWSL